MKTRLYLLAKDVPHPNAKGHFTRVFFTGEFPAPTWGPAYPDGMRSAILFPTQSAVQQTLDRLPQDFKSGLIVMDAVLEMV